MIALKKTWTQLPCRVRGLLVFQQPPFRFCVRFLSSRSSRLLLCVGLVWRPSSTVVVIIQHWVASALAGLFWFSLCCFSKFPLPIVPIFSWKNGSFRRVLQPLSPSSSFLPSCVARVPRRHADWIKKTDQVFTEEAIQKRHKMLSGLSVQTVSQD